MEISASGPKIPQIPPYRILSSDLVSSYTPSRAANRLDLRPAAGSSFTMQCSSSYGSKMLRKLGAIRTRRTKLWVRWRSPRQTLLSVLFSDLRRGRKRRVLFRPGNTGLPLCRHWRFTLPRAPGHPGKAGTKQAFWDIGRPLHDCRGSVWFCEGGRGSPTPSEGLQTLDETLAVKNILPETART